MRTKEEIRKEIEETFNEKMLLIKKEDYILAGKLSVWIDALNWVLEE